MTDTHTDVPPSWVTPSELASALGVTASTVRRYEESGKIPHATRTLGGNRRWRRSDVEHLLTEHAQKAGA